MLNQQAPKIISENSSRDTVELLFDISPDLPCFAGHFPDEPIVPGVVQIGWAVEFADRLGLSPRDFSSVPRAKFSATIHPGTELRLKLVRHADTVDFSYSSADTLHSNGKMRFGR